MARTSRKQKTSRRPISIKRTRSAAKPQTYLAELLKGIQSLSVAELRKLVEHATSLIEQKTEGEKKSFIEEVSTRAQSLGLSLRDLFGKSTATSQKRTPAKRANGRSAGLPVKFRSPSGEGWSGRGRKPLWLVKFEAEGKSKDEFAV
jgi:DNA-binding protein H-NS